VAIPVTAIGRVWGTSASRAPSVTTSWVPSASASSVMTRLNVRHFMEGSCPTSSTRSRGALGTRASYSSTSGHTIWRAWPSTSLTCGRVLWKS